MAAIPEHKDPTLAALDAVIESANDSRPRPYLGASQIGQPCSRALWFSFRWTTQRHIPAAGLRRIQDGFRGEAVLIDWLRKVPDIELWTVDPENEENQISIVDCGGHFRGHLDGVIQGLKQAPKTPHVWESKICNESKFNKLRKLITEKGEKNALKEWDETYYAQAQVYMRGTELTRHYLTVATPGCRDIVSCRTAYNKTDADALIKKAETIIAAERPPLKLSDNPSWWQCKLCDHTALCHGQAMPAVNCRTCAHSTARLNDAHPWTCELNQPAINGDQTGCDHHAFHPDLLVNHAEAVNANPKTGVITFKLHGPDGLTFQNGIGCVSSRTMWEKEQAVSKPAPAPLEDDILIELATDSAIPAESLLTGQVDETEWPKFTQAVTVFWDRWNHDEPRMARLRNLIEVIDGAYFELMERGTV
jgi:hypothetical protein